MGMKLKETIRPCVCCKNADGDTSMFTGMPVLRPARNDYPERFQVNWTIKCPECGRGGILEFKSVQAAIRRWNKMQDRQWEFMDGFDVPTCYPLGEQETYEPLYKRYHEVIQQIGYGYLLSMPAEEKKPLFEHMGLQKKVELLEGVLRRKQTEEAERKRRNDEIEEFLKG